MREKKQPMYYHSIQRSEALKEILHESVSTGKADMLLLSGGVDSSALAALDRNIPAYTTSLKGLSERFDLKFAGRVAKHLKLNWVPVIVTQAEAVENLRPVIRINESYDIALLNDLALYIAINRAITDLGKANITVRSGEPADMLFRGYFATYFMNQTMLNYSIDREAASSLPLAKLETKTQIKVDYPYLSPKVKEFAKSLSIEDTMIYRNKPGDVWSIHTDNSEKLKGPPYPFGKLILRQAMFGILPQEVSLRIKTDIQFGSGTDTLKTYLRTLISPLERAAFEAEGFSFRNDEHAAMYKLYREEGLTPRPPIRGKEDICASCYGAVAKGTIYCVTCGAYPSNISFDVLRKIRVHP
jgi:asparagine synthetase B (glutamine-hydrolysing)